MSSHSETSTNVGSRTGYEVTKDPFALFAFALLIFTIVAFAFLIIVTARRSSLEIRDGLRTEKRKRHLADRERAPEAAIALMSSTYTPQKTMQQATQPEPQDDQERLRRVRFSEVVDMRSVPAAPIAFDEIYEDWKKLNGGHSARGKRQSMSDLQLTELHLST